MRRPKLSYANVMSTIAVFIALGGTSYAVARNSIGTAQLKSNAVTSAKIKNGTVATGDLAPSARGGQRGPRGPQGPPGTSGAGGGAVDLQPEAWHAFEFLNGWQNYGADTFGAAAYRKDKQGEVHLRGLVSQDGGTPTHTETMMVLPPGYRPQVRQLFVTSSGNGDQAGGVIINTDGTIDWNFGSVAERDYTSLAGITFYTD